MYLRARLLKFSSRPRRVVLHTPTFTTITSEMIPYGMMNIEPPKKTKQRTETDVTLAQESSEEAASKTSSRVEYHPPADLLHLGYVNVAHNAARQRYIDHNPMSRLAHDEACRYAPGGNTRTVLHTSPFPLTFGKFFELPDVISLTSEVAGKGCELKSKDGDWYTDFLGEYSAGIFGHSNPFIKAAVDGAMAVGWNLGGPNEYEHKLQKKVTQRFGPSGCELVRFTNSGTEANTMAIAAAVAYTGRDTILVFSDGYHGGTLSFPRAMSNINTNLPHNFVFGEYNDITHTIEVLKNLSPDTLAAIIVEPIQGSAGCIVGSQTFLRSLQSLAKQLGAVFIVDEVMTSRLAYNGLSHELGLQPDIVTLGKWVGGGMTFGAFGGMEKGPLMCMFDPVNGALHHSGTYNNNVVTMAAGCAGLEIYDEEQVDRLNSMGEKMKSQIEALLLKHGLAPHLDLYVGKSKDTLAGLDRKSRPRMWLSGQESMLCINFGGQLKDQEKLYALYWFHMLENGIYLAPRGFIALNIALEEEHVDKFVQATEGFVMKYWPALDEGEHGSVKEMYAGDGDSMTLIED